MITDVFAAEPGGLAAYRRAGFPAPGGYGYPTLKGRDLDPAALAVLDMLLSGVPARRALDDAARPAPAPASAPGPDGGPDLYAGPVVAVLSERVVRLLPAVPDDRLEGLAKDWTAQAEIGGVPVEAVAAWLAGLRRMLPDAVRDGRMLLVWNCL